MEGLGGEWDIKFDHDSIHTSVWICSYHRITFGVGLKGRGSKVLSKKKIWDPILDRMEDSVTCDFGIDISFKAIDMDKGNVAAK